MIAKISETLNYFSSVKNGSTFFFIIWYAPIPPCDARNINYLFNFFKCLMLFIVITPNHKFNINCCFKIIVIRVSIIKVYSIKNHTITKKCNNITVYIIKVYIIIREYNIIKYLNHFSQNKLIRNKF